MKQFFLVLCCMSLALSGSYADDNQNKVKSVFFGGTNYFLVKKITSNWTQPKQSNCPIKKHQHTINVKVEHVPEPTYKTIKPIYSDAFIMDKRLVILDPADTETKRRFHSGFNPVVEMSKENFLQEFLTTFKFKKNSISFYATKEDEYHIHWHVKGVSASTLPVMVEHVHEGRCPSLTMCEELLNRI